MKISIVSAVGHARTPLSAFDNALQQCGVYNYNLIVLSSIIPPQTELAFPNRYTASPNEFGHRLYVVRAEIRSDAPTGAIAAGLGWYQWGDNRGIFVEHEVVDTTVKLAEDKLRYTITQSIEDLCLDRQIPFNKNHIGIKIASFQMNGHPASAMVIAVYQSQNWETKYSEDWQRL